MFLQLFESQVERHRFFCLGVFIVLWLSSCSSMFLLFSPQVLVGV